ncbi:Galanin [Beggiatoa sp. PS]|nr:Galanin [Beggiatoa sp. PS]
MVTQNELKAFYETDLKPKLLFFEEQRLLFVSKRKVIWIIYGILVIFAILAVIMVFNLKLEAGYLQTIYRKFLGKGLYAYYVDDKDVVWMVVFGLIMYVITFYMAIAHSYTKMKSAYRNHFKTTVVGSLVTFIDKDLSYAPKDDSTVKELLFKQEFHNSHLFRGNDVYRWNGEDYVGGILGGTNLNVSEIHVETQYTRKKYSPSVSYFDIFKGLFFVFNLNWNFEGVTTVIVPNDSGDYYLKNTCN